MTTSKRSRASCRVSILLISAGLPQRWRKELALRVEWGTKSIVMVIMIVGQGILMLAMVVYVFRLMNIMGHYQKAFKKCLLEARKHAAAQDGHI